MKVKVNQTGIKVYSLVGSIISSSLKEMSLQVSECKPVLQPSPSKNQWNRSSLPWILIDRDRDYELNSFLRATRKFSDMIGTLPYIAGPCWHHCKLTKEMYIRLRQIPKKGTVSCWHSINWAIERNWQTQATWNMEGHSADFASSEKC